MTFTQFTAKQFPERSVFDRKQFDFTTNLVKWIALQFAFFAYKIGITANVLDVSAIFLVFIGYCFLVTAMNGVVLLPIIGIFCIYFLIFVDFADGPIAKASNSCSMLGHLLDDLGCNLARLMLIVLFGIYTESYYLILLAAFSSGVLIIFVPLAVKEMPSQGFIGTFVHLYYNKYSFLSVRFMLALLPLFLGITIVCGWDLKVISFVVTIFYGISSILWLSMSFLNYPRSKNIQ